MFGWVNLKIDYGGVVATSVQSMVHCLDRGFIEKAEIGDCLAGLLSENQGWWADQSEGVNDSPCQIRPSQ